MNFLAQIIEQKRAYIAQLHEKRSLPAWRECAQAARRNATAHRLCRALCAETPPVKIIAEYKRASPSKGAIRLDLSIDDVAARYERGGASGISVLTEHDFFAGSLDDLVALRAQTKLPLLQKDFVLDAAQIYEAAVAGADAILLIVAALNDSTLRALREIAEDELGLDVLVEVHSAAEMRRAAESGARLIGVNNRDLQTFVVSLETSARLIADARAGAILVSESGLSAPNDIERLRALGYDGFLIGETLMRAPDPEASLRELMSEPGTP